MWTIDEDGPVFVNTDSPKIDFYCSRLCYPTAGKRSLISRGQSTGGSHFLADNSKFSLDMEIQIGNSFMRKYRVNVATSKYRISIESNNGTSIIKRVETIYYFFEAFSRLKSNRFAFCYFYRNVAPISFFFSRYRGRRILFIPTIVRLTWIRYIDI